MEHTFPKTAIIDGDIIAYAKVEATLVAAGIAVINDEGDNQ